METIHKDIKTLLNDALELRNVNHKKLAELTGISERYLWAIQNLEMDKLPSAPYVRGYIKKISETLQLNHDEIWELYKKELETNTSGAYDTLPMNRFAIKHLSKKNQLGILLGILLMGYIFFNAARIVGKPFLIVSVPTDPVITITEKEIQLSGKINYRDKLTINNEEIFLNPDGTFSKMYSLQPGINTIEFKARRFLGQETKVLRQVIYQQTFLPSKN